jgi:hypothetical protein
MVFGGNNWVASGRKKELEQVMILVPIQAQHFPDSTPATQYSTPYLYLSN